MGNQSLEGRWFESILLHEISPMNQVQTNYLNDKRSEALASLKNATEAKKQGKHTEAAKYLQQFQLANQMVNNITQLKN